MQLRQLINQYKSKTGTSLQIETARRELLSNSKATFKGIVSDVSGSYILISTFLTESNEIESEFKIQGSNLIKIHTGDLSSEKLRQLIIGDMLDLECSPTSIAGPYGPDQNEYIMKFRLLNFRNIDFAKISILNYKRNPYKLYINDVYIRVINGFFNSDKSTSSNYEFFIFEKGIYKFSSKEDKDFLIYPSKYQTIFNFEKSKTEFRWTMSGN